MSWRIDVRPEVFGQGDFAQEIAILLDCVKGASLKDGPARRFEVRVIGTNSMRQVNNRWEASCLRQHVVVLPKEKERESEYGYDYDCFSLHLMEASLAKK